MTLDSSRKRQLSLATGQVWYPPTPTITGHIDKSDRKAIAWGYLGVLEEEEELEQLVMRQTPARGISQP